MKRRLTWASVSRLPEGPGGAYAAESLCIELTLQYMRSASKTTTHSRDAVPRQAHDLHRFLIEVVFVEPLDLVPVAQPHANIVLDHEACQLAAVDQDDPLRAAGHVSPRATGE